MSPSPMQFMAYDDSRDRPNVVVDGSPNAATVLTLSHWPGQPIPSGCGADTSTQMVFRYLDHGADRHGSAAVVTNNHFDQDGLAGIYALTDPDAARPKRGLLEDLAAAGDFGVLGDRAAARLSMAVAALADPERSPLEVPAGDDVVAVRYRAALELLPDWLDDPGRCRSLWVDEDAELEAGLWAVATGDVAIEEVGDLDLAVVTLPDGGRSAGHRFTDRRFTGVHPMALHRATERSAMLVLDPHEGRHHLTDRYEGWVQLHSRTVRRRRDLRPLAEVLTEMEPGPTRWRAAAPDDLSPTLATDGSGPPSSLSPKVLTAVVSEHLRHSPAAWDPHRGHLIPAGADRG